MINFLPESYNKRDDFNVVIIHFPLVIDIYQPLPLMEFIFHNSCYAGVYIETYYNDNVF
jgi:hypothetical protein